MIITLLKPQY